MRSAAMGALVAVAVSISAAPVPKVPPKPVLTCELKAEGDPRAGAKELVVTATITNRTQEPIDVTWTLNPMEWLDLVVMDQNGRRLQTTPYWYRFSPYSFEPQHFLLAPNDPHRQSIHLETVFPDYKLPPGTYKVMAVFRYHLLRCHSAEVIVVVK